MADDRQWSRTLSRRKWRSEGTATAEKCFPAKNVPKRWAALSAVKCWPEYVPAAGVLRRWISLYTRSGVRGYKQSLPTSPAATTGH
jgi:hypothetical protein